MIIVLQYMMLIAYLRNAVTLSVIFDRPQLFIEEHSYVPSLLDMKGSMTLFASGEPLYVICASPPVLTEH